MSDVIQPLQELERYTFDTKEGGTEDWVVLATDLVDGRRFALLAPADQVEGEQDFIEDFSVFFYSVSPNEQIELSQVEDDELGTRIFEHFAKLMGFEEAEES